MANLTRIKNNQITDATIYANVKIAPGTIVGSLFNANLTTNSDVTIGGNLVVLGSSTYTTIASTNTYVNDPLIVLNNAFTGTNTYDLGFIFNRGNQINQALYWNESNKEFRFTATNETGTAYGDLGTPSSYANLHVGNVTIQYDLAVDGGYLTTAASTFNLANTTATTVNIGGDATSLLIGATTGTITLRNATVTTPGQIVSTHAGSAATGGGQVYLNGSTNNRIDWAATGTGAPAFTTRSNGTKLVLYPALSGSSVDYAIGIDSSTLWSSVPEAGDSFNFKWYGATTLVANLSGTGNFTTTGDLAVNGGDITTTAGTASVFNTDATTVNAFGAATAITAGATTGYYNIRNANLQLQSATIINAPSLANIFTASSTLAVANEVPTTVNAFGAATSLTLGGTSGTASLRNANIYLPNATTVFSGQTNLTLANEVPTTVSAFGAATTLTLGGTSGTASLRNANIYLPNATTIFTGQTTVSFANSVATTVDAFGSATGLYLSASTGETVIRNNLSSLGILYANSATASTSATSGGLVVAGGIGISGSIFATQGANIARANLSAGVDSSTTTSGTFIVTGGAGISGNLNVGGNLVVNQPVTFTAPDNAQSRTDGGALTVVGGLAVAKDSFFGGNVTIYGNVDLRGNTTIFSSNNIAVQDSIIELNYVNGGVLTGDNQQDIGFRMHFYDTGNNNAFLGRAHDSGYLEWYGRDATENGNVAIEGTYGTFKSGNIILEGTDDTTNSTTGALQVKGGVGIAKDLFVGGGDILTNQTTFNVINTTATTVNAFGAATTLTLGATTGTADIRNANLYLPNATTIYSGQTTVAVLNQNVTTANVLGAATLIGLGATTGTLEINNPTVVGTQSTQNLYNATATTMNFAGAATTITVGATSGNTEIRNDLTAKRLNNTPIGDQTPSSGRFSSLYDTALNDTAIPFISSTQFVTDPVFTFTYASKVLTVNTLTFDGDNNTIGTTNANGNLSLDPNGTGSISAANHRIVSVADPLDQQDAVTKYYLENALATAVNNLVFDDTDITIADHGGSNIGIITANVDGHRAITITANTFSIYGDGSINDANAKIYIDQIASLVTVGSKLNISDTSASANSSDGALVVEGGVGVVKNMTIGKGLVVNTDTSGENFTVYGRYTSALLATNSDYQNVIINGPSGGSNVIVQPGASLQINSDDTMLIPVGPTSTRPSSNGNVDVSGMLRFNTSLGTIEWYDGFTWATPGNNFTVITSEQLNGDGVSNVFVMSYSSTTASTVVSINGILQIPTLAYSISGTTLTFTEPPAIGDVIDVRVLTTTVTLGHLESSNGVNAFLVNDPNNLYANIRTGTSGPGTDRISVDTTGIVNLVNGTKLSYDQTPQTVTGTSAVIIDSWAQTKYTSAKYIVQAKYSTTNMQVFEALVITDGAGNAYISTVNSVHNGSAIGSLSVSVVSGSVKLSYTSSSLTPTSVKVSATYIV